MIIAPLKVWKVTFWRTAHKANWTVKVLAHTEGEASLIVLPVAHRIRKIELVADKKGSK